MRIGSPGRFRSKLIRLCWASCERILMVERYWDTRRSVTCINKGVKARGPLSYHISRWPTSCFTVVLPATPGYRLTGVSRYRRERKSTRLNSSHQKSSYAVFCLKKKNFFYDLQRYFMMTKKSFIFILGSCAG